MPIRVVSVDMFQTLVDVNCLRYYFWEKVLGKNYSESIADEYTEQWGKLFPNHFNETVRRAGGYLSLKPVFESFWAKLFKQFSIEIQYFVHRRSQCRQRMIIIKGKYNIDLRDSSDLSAHPGPVIDRRAESEVRRAKRIQDQRSRDN